MGMDYLVAGLVGQAMGAVLSISAAENGDATPWIVGNLLLVLGTGVLVAGCGIFGDIIGSGDGGDCWDCSVLLEY